MEAVNLLPAYARPGHPWAAVGKDLSARRVFKAGSVVACVAAVGLGLGYFHERSVVNDRHATLADVQAQVAVADAKAAPLRAAQAAAAARMAAAGTVSEKRVAWEATALGRLACAAEAGLPAEPVRAVADAAGTWCGGCCSDDAAGRNDGSGNDRRIGLLGDGRRVLAREGRGRPRPAREPALAHERNARVEHERRRERHDTVPRRHVHRHRRLQPERRCEMIDRISGRLALLLAVVRAARHRPGRLVRVRVAPELEGRGTRLADRRREHQARDDAVIHAEPGVEAERRGPPSSSPRDPGRRGDVRDPPAAFVGLPRERRQDREHHAFRGRFRRPGRRQCRSPSRSRVATSGSRSSCTCSGSRPGSRTARRTRRGGSTASTTSRSRPATRAA